MRSIMRSSLLQAPPPPPPLLLFMLLLLPEVALRSDRAGDAPAAGAKADVVSAACIIIIVKVRRARFGFGHDEQVDWRHHTCRMGNHFLGNPVLGRLSLQNRVPVVWFALEGPLYSRNFR